MNLLESNQRLSIRERLSLVFGVDIRAMAVFRIAAGIIILADLVLRWPTLRYMGADDGCVTREVVSGFWTAIFGEGISWPLLSIHHWSGAFEYQLFLFGLAAFFAVLLVVGFQTRLATFFSFILLASLHARNPLILSSGDMILKMLLFWAIFLPLGRVWSLDAWFKGRNLRNQAHWVCHVGTAGILIQFACMYFFTGISKWNDVWFDGHAMEYVMRLDIYVRPLGRQLLEYPELLKFISISTVYIEVFSPLLLLIPFKNHWFRILNIAIYIGLHSTIAATMSIGLFSFISMIGWTIFLPTICFAPRNWMTSFRTQAAKPENSWFGRLPASVFRRPKLTWGKTLFAPGLFMIGMVIAWNVNNIYLNYHQRLLPMWLEGVGRLVMFDQHFQMFDRPPETSPWFVYEAELNDGTKVDLFTGETPQHEKPEDVRRKMKYHHIRKLHRNLVSTFDNPYNVEPVRDVFREALAKYYIRKWNESHPKEQQVRNFRLICYQQLIGPATNDFDQRHKVWYEEQKAGSLFQKEFEKFNQGDFF